MANKYFNGRVVNTKVNEDVDNELIELINALDEKVEKRMWNRRPMTNSDLYPT